MASPADKPQLPARKPANMAWESFVDRRIREAEEAGQFDNLPGAGQPIPGIDDPPDDNWWIKQKLRDEGLSVLPPVLEAKLALERTLEELPRMTSEIEVRRRLREINQRIREAVSSPAAGPAVVLVQADVEQIVLEWRSRRSH
jgi:hypothetical protein